MSSTTKKTVKLDPRDPDDHWYTLPDGTLRWIDPDPKANAAWRDLVDSYRVTPPPAAAAEVEALPWE